MDQDSPATVEAWIKRHEGIWGDTRDQLWTSRVQQAIQHNKHRTQAPNLEIGSWALLDSGDWRGRHRGGVDKLKERFEGPYRVTKVFNDGLDVGLNLPEGDKRNPVFHISKVKPFVEREDAAAVEHETRVKK